MITLFGAAPDTGNQGVTALCHSAVAGLAARGVASLVVADHGRGLRQETWTIGGRRIPVSRMGATHTRRIYRPDSLTAIRLCLGAGGLGNTAAQVLKASRAVLDVSGGDSFTDLYGPRRFDAMTLSKRMALSAGRPLILLPQTLGPFNHPSCRLKAAALLRSAAAVWTRDAKSLELLAELLGPDFDLQRHRQGVDMALALPAEEPREALPPRIRSWLGQADEGASGPVIGINVSGLLFNSGDGGRGQFGLKSCYREAMQLLAQRLLLQNPGARLLLVPHVLVDAGHPESDWSACRDLQGYLRLIAPGRTEVLPPNYGAAELKSILSWLDWFCGTRMHATIGAASMGVPTLALAYSDKTEGVFEACGLIGMAADLRAMDAKTLTARAARSLDQRRATRAALGIALPHALAQAEAQMDEIARGLRALNGIRAAA
ncbi:polysaccharide pyruvyl transferase family protein [Limibacillus halophilus]